MKVEINTKDRTVYVQANDMAGNLDQIDRWISAIRTGRAWLKRELDKLERAEKRE